MDRGCGISKECSIKFPKQPDKIIVRVMVNRSQYRPSSEREINRRELISINIRRFHDRLVEVRRAAPYLRQARTRLNNEISGMVLLKTTLFFLFFPPFFFFFFLL